MNARKGGGSEFTVGSDLRARSPTPPIRTRTVYIHDDENIETLFKVEAGPLEAIEGGHGYMGIMLRNKNTDTIQCHACGKWFKGLQTHIRMHGMIAREYKLRYGLPLGIGLVSRSVSLAHRKRMLKPETLARLAKYRKSMKQRPRGFWTRYGQNSAAARNKKGLCDQQILERLLIVAEIVGRSPSQKDLVKYDSSLLKPLQRRHGGLNKFRRQYGLKEIHSGSKRQWTETKVLAAIRKQRELLNRAPIASDFTAARNGVPCLVTIIRVLGCSWRRARAMALEEIDRP